MKKIYSFLAILTCLSFDSTAQTWCAPGARWQYYIRGSFPASGPFGTQEVKFADTATVAGKSCDEMRGVIQSTFGPTPGGIPSEGAGPLFYVCEENGVVWFSEGSSWDTLADMKAIPGDGWYAYWDSDTGFSKRVVVDTGHVMINNQTRRALYFDSLHRHSFIEGIGYDFGFFIPYKWYWPNTTDIFPYNGDFRCYTDSLLGIYTVDENWSCVRIDVGIKESKTDRINFYPNPSGGIFHLDDPPNGTMMIYSVEGRLVCSMDIDQTKQVIDLTRLDKGIYMIFLKGESVNQMSRVIIE